MKKHQWFGLLCGSFVAVSGGAQTMIDAFEYATDDELLAAWVPDGNTTLSMSDSVAVNATGKKSLKIDFRFPSVAWSTDVLNGPTLTTPISVEPQQYVTYRIRGDSAFTNSSFRNIYIYAWDGAGNFGRWPTSVPVNNDWQVINIQGNKIEAPWNSPGLPDTTQLIKFAIYQYGSGDPAVPEYTATIYIDELMVRDTPLIDFPPPSPPRALIDDFESYSDDTALRNFYSYEIGGATTVTTASLQSPAPQGTKALKLAIDFAPGQWPWGSVRSPILTTPFSIPTNAVVSLRLKGDPTLAPVADAGTVFWLTFYDKSGTRMSFITQTAPVISSDWTTLEAHLTDFDNTTTIDTGNLVQWRILVEGWQGTAESAAMSGAFYVDDIRVTVPAEQPVPPVLSVSRAGTVLTLTAGQLVVGKTYELRSAADLNGTWIAVGTTNAATTSVSLPVPINQERAFFKLVGQ